MLTKSKLIKMAKLLDEAVGIAQSCGYSVLIDTRRDPDIPLSDGVRFLVGTDDSHGEVFVTTADMPPAERAQYVHGGME